MTTKVCLLFSEQLVVSVSEACKEEQLIAREYSILGDDIYTRYIVNRERFHRKRILIESALNQ